MNSLFYAGALITLFTTMVLCLGSIAGAFELNDRLRKTFLSVVNLLSVLIVAWLGFTTGYAFQTPYLQIMAVSGILSFGMVFATVFIGIGSVAVVENSQEAPQAKNKPKPLITESLLKEIPVDQGGVLATPRTYEEKKVLVTAED